MASASWPEAFSRTTWHTGDHMVHTEQRFKDPLQFAGAFTGIYDVDPLIAQHYLEDVDRPLFFTSTRVGTSDKSCVLTRSQNTFMTWSEQIQSPRATSLRSLSPSDSGMSSSHYGDYGTSPIWSPAIASATHSTDTHHDPYTHYSLGMVSHPVLDHTGGTSSCVAMHEVQACADALPDTTVFDDEALAYGTNTQEGYHPVTYDQELSLEESYDTMEQTHNVVRSEAMAQPVAARRRTSSTRSNTPYSPGKVSKRAQASSTRSGLPGKPRRKRKSECNAASHRAFPCPFTPYGCNSSFGSKNEWKRHVATQHMQLESWRCDQCPVNKTNTHNDFNRKDLFIQHVRRMHCTSASKTASGQPKSGKRGQDVDADEQALIELSRSCLRRLRSPPEESGCLFCPNVFQSWDVRMEHIGRHMESARKDNKSELLRHGNWLQDKATESWLIREGLVLRKGKDIFLA